MQKDLNVVKTQSVKTGIQKLLVSARMATSLSRETLPTAKVSKLFNEVTCEKCVPGGCGRRLKAITLLWSYGML